MPNQVAYGFLTLESLYDQRVNLGQNVDVVTTAIEQSLAVHQEVVDSLLDLFVTRQTVAKRVFRSSTLARLQPIDQLGRALPIRPGGKYETGWPLQMAGSAWGVDWKTQAKMTVREVGEMFNLMLMADLRWVRDHIIGALLNDANWSYDDEEFGTVTVLPIANGDTQLYLTLAGADAQATADHQVAQAAAIADGANPFPTIHDLLMAHPENGGQIVALVPTGLMAAVGGLATFVERADPNINLNGSAVVTLDGALSARFPGMLRGYERSGIWVVEWSSMPANYIIATTTDGDRPVAMREPVEPEMRGFIQKDVHMHHPWWETQYVRQAGFGVWNRVGAVAYRIGNASYATPTGYASPMP